MKLKVWGEKKDEEILAIRLKEDHDGGITLMSVDKKGCQLVALLRIRPDGYLYRFSGIGGTDLPTSPHGKIALVGSDA